MMRRVLASLRRFLPSSGDGPGDASGGGPDDGSEAGPDDGGEDDVEPGADADGFVRSRLDASVITAHGDDNPDGERELASVQEEARQLEEERR